MYLFRHDADVGLAIWISQHSTEAEWDANFAHVVEVTGWSSKIGKRAAVICMALDRPPTTRRVELARLTEAPGYDPHIAFVGLSAPLRAVLTMFGWIQKAPQYEMCFVDSMGSAVEWLEKKRGERLEKLRAMLTDISAEYVKVSGKELP